MSSDDPRVGFIKWIVGEDEVGYIGLAARVSSTGDWLEQTFKYPEETFKIDDFLRRHTPVGDIYFCPTILEEPKRVKENVKHSRVLWADLDDCTPDVLKVAPSMVIESSPDRYQAYWRLDEATHANDVELWNRAIAYYHEDDGADISGWDLTQLLRVPETKNFKYDERPKVKIFKYSGNTTTLAEIQEHYPKPEEQRGTIPDIPFPEFMTDRTSAEILNDIKPLVNAKVFTLFEDSEALDRSKTLFQLMQLLFAAGLSLEEVYVVCRDAKCNKFKNPVHLWKDVIRSKAYHDNKSLASNPTGDDVEVASVTIPNRKLLTKAQRDRIKEDDDNIISQYLSWAGRATDAAPQYHLASVFTLLSCLLSSTLVLQTSFGPIKPNLWFMILGDTTTSRKSTSMNLGIDMLNEIDRDCLLASDGTTEGLMTAMALRPGRSSLFHRDEVAGLLAAMRKEYNAGLLEFFTQLYDGRRVKRVLRKETIEIHDPVLVLLTAGTKDGVYSNMNSSHIDSGFAPRFIYIAADSDPSRIRGLGPPTMINDRSRDGLVMAFQDIYNRHVHAEKDDPFIGTGTKEVTLTDEAWAMFNDFDGKMQQISSASTIEAQMSPMMSRLAMSGLKVAMLIAAADCKRKIVVTEEHMLRAFYYVDGWKEYAFDLVMNAGRTVQERQLDKLYESIEKAGVDGIQRSILMRAHKLMTRDMEMLLTTLEQRGLITIVRVGKGIRITANKTITSEVVV